MLFINLEPRALVQRWLDILYFCKVWGKGDSSLTASEARSHCIVMSFLILIKKQGLHVNSQPVNAIGVIQQCNPKSFHQLLVSWSFESLELVVELLHEKYIWILFYSRLIRFMEVHYCLKVFFYIWFLSIVLYYMCAHSALRSLWRSVCHNLHTMLSYAIQATNVSIFLVCTSL